MISTKYRLFERESVFHCLYGLVFVSLEVVNETDVVEEPRAENVMSPYPLQNRLCGSRPAVTFLESSLSESDYGNQIGGGFSTNFIMPRRISGPKAFNQHLLRCSGLVCPGVHRPCTQQGLGEYRAVPHETCF